MDNKILDELVEMQNVVLDIRESLDRLSPIADTEENLTFLRALHNGLTSYLVVINSHIPQPTTPEQIR